MLVFRLTALKNTGIPGSASNIAAANAAAISAEASTTAAAINDEAAAIEDAAAYEAVIVTEPKLSTSLNSIVRTVRSQAQPQQKAQPQQQMSSDQLSGRPLPEPLSQSQRRLTATLSLQLCATKPPALPQKRAHSLSSSDTSIASTCDLDLERSNHKFDESATSSATVLAATDNVNDCDGDARSQPRNTPSNRTMVGVHKSSPSASVELTPPPSPTQSQGRDEEEDDEAEAAVATKQPAPTPTAPSPPPVNIALLPGYKHRVSYRFLNCETRLLRRLLQCHGLTEVYGDDKPFTLLWTGCHLKTETLRALRPHQRVNHFPRSTELTRKDRLYKNIEKMQQGVRGYRTFDIVPQSFMLPVEYRSLVAWHRAKKTPLIVKPAASSRGRGIFLVHSVS